MPRGKKKSIDEKINEQQNLIQSLKIRLTKEEKVLKNLLKDKKQMNTNYVEELIRSSNLSPEEAKKAIQEYINQHSQQSA